MKKLIIVPLIFFVFTTYAQRYNWSYDDKKEFIKECIEEKELQQFLTSSEQSELCDCSLYEIQDEIKNKKGADLLDENEVMGIIYPCLPKGWSNKVTKMMMEECEKDVTEDFCKCYLENLKKRFPDFWEFSLLAAEGKISDELMESLLLPCLE